MSWNTKSRWMPAITSALFVFMAVAFGSSARADVKFTRLSDDQFIIHHRKQTMFGAEAKATRTAYGEAAAICLAAGFSHLEIKDTNTGERTHGGLWGGGRGASADVRVRFFLDPGEEDVEERELIECQGLDPDPKKVGKAKQKLAKGK